MWKAVTVQIIVYLISFIFIDGISTGVLESNDHRRPRSLGGMNFGNQGAGNMGPAGMQGANDLVGGGLRNPERPQLESIYRGKIFWGGNGTENKPDNEVVFGTGRFADEETDKFGNPIEEPKRGPRPKINPQRKEDTRREKRNVNQQERIEAQELGHHILGEKFIPENLQKVKMDEEIPFEIQLVDENDLKAEHKIVVPRPKVNPLKNDMLNDGPDTVGDTRSVGDILRAERKLKPGRRPNINPLRTDVQNGDPISFVSSSYSVQPRHKCEMLDEGPDTVGDTRSVGDILRADTKLKVGPRPNINRLKNDMLNDGPDTLGDTRSVGDIVRAERVPKEDVNENKQEDGHVKPKIISTVLKNSLVSHTKDSPAHSIQKRDLPSHQDIHPGVRAEFKGPQIISQYKGPQIISQYKGPQIISQYTGAQIRSQYMGPHIRSEYKGKIISMLGGVEAYEKMSSAAAAAAQSTPAVLCMAERLNEMNQQLEQDKIMRYVRNKPKLKSIFQEP